MEQYPITPKRLVFTAIIFAVVGILIFRYFGKKITHVRRCSEEIPAFITERHSSAYPNFHGSGYLTTVKYEYGGKTYELGADEASKLGDVGDHIDIRINPERPEEFIAVSPSRYYASGIVGCALGIFMMLTAIACFITLAAGVYA